jgi:hypothetical protein
MCTAYAKSDGGISRMHGVCSTKQEVLIKQFVFSCHCEHWYLVSIWNIMMASLLRLSQSMCTHLPLRVHAYTSTLLNSLPHAPTHPFFLKCKAATRWYRAPEMLYAARFYGSPVDMSDPPTHPPPSPPSMFECMFLRLFLTLPTALEFTETFCFCLFPGGGRGVSWASC